MIKGLIFDLDGVIVDTAKYHFLAWKRLADDLNLSFSIKDNELLKGVSRTKSCEIIFNLNNKEIATPDIEKYCKIKNDYYLEYINNLKKEEIFPGVKEFIQDARNKGYKTAIGSVSKNTNLILDKLQIRDLFDAIIDGNKIVNAKPNPEVFIKGANELNLKNEECIVFEDSLAGIVAANNANMCAIGVSNLEVKDAGNMFINAFTKINIDNIVRRI